VRELEPSTVAVPGPLVIALSLEDLSIDIEYLQENLVGESMNLRGGISLKIIGAVWTYI